jgi:hypothetical protein
MAKHNFTCYEMSLTLKEEVRLRWFENRALGNIFFFKRVELRGSWKNFHNGTLMICTPRQILLGSLNQKG